MEVSSCLTCQFSVRSIADLPVAPAAGVSELRETDDNVGEGGRVTRHLVGLRSHRLRVGEQSFAPRLFLVYTVVLQINAEGKHVSATARGDGDEPAEPHVTPVANLRAA